MTCSVAYGAARGIRNLSAALLLGSGVAIAEPVTIAALGDSLTQGYGVFPGQGFVPQLNDWLDKAGADVKILNAGVSGDTTRGGLSRVDWTLTPDVDAMIVALGGNDLLRGIDPAVSRANLDAILTKARAADVPVMLVGLYAPGNYGADFKQQFDGMYADLAQQHDVVFAPNFLEGLDQAARNTGDRAQFLQRDGIHPNALGVTQIVAVLGPKVLELIKRVD